MKNPKVVIMMMTWYPKMEKGTPEMARALAALRSLEVANNQDINVLVSDGGSCELFLDPASKFDYVKIVPQAIKGLDPGRMELFKNAATIYPDARAFLCTEADRWEIVKDAIKITRPILEGAAMVTLPARTKETWKSWPKAQQHGEQAMNEVFKELTGISGDISMGPRAWAPKLTPYFIFDYAEKNPKLKSNWTSTYMGVMAAAYLGIPIGFVETAYTVPKDIKEAEDADEATTAKRKDQLETMTTVMREGWKSLSRGLFE